MQCVHYAFTQVDVGLISENLLAPEVSAPYLLFQNPAESTLH